MIRIRCRRYTDPVDFVRVGIIPAGIDGVGHQIEQAAMQAAMVEQYIADFGRQLRFKGDVIFPGNGFHQFHNLLNDVIWTAGRHLGLAFFGV